MKTFIVTVLVPETFVDMVNSNFEILADLFSDYYGCRLFIERKDGDTK